MVAQMQSMEDEEMRMVSFPKKVWKVVRVFLYMLRKGICKKKLLMDLNLLLKRGKLAGKAALVNLTLFHHHHHAASSGAPREYEFSCSNTPAHPGFLISHVLQAAGKSSRKGKGAPAKYPSWVEAEEEIAMGAAALHVIYNAEASPVLPGLGFGRSPLVRQLRVTDSPYPLEGGDCHVDQAADEFIKRFYSHLRTQSITDS